MLAFAVNEQFKDIEYAHAVWQTIANLRRYFYYYNPNPDLAEEAMQRAYIHAIENRKAQHKDLTPYIKKLARTIMRKSNVKEYSYSLYDDESGEVAFIFSQQLREEIDMTHIDGIEDVLEELRDLYLLMPDEFKLFSGMYADNVEKLQVIKNASLKRHIEKMTKKYGGKVVFKAIEQVLLEINKETTAPPKEPVIKEIRMKPADFEKYEKRLCVNEGIMATDGTWGYISPETYKTEPFDADMKKWTIKTTCPIIKCDISQLKNYMYEKLFVQEGVSNAFIMWAGKRYRLTTPGSHIEINMDLYQFMDLIHKELIINMLRENVNKIIAISEDSVYIKPTRGVSFETIRLRLFTGAIIDLPCEVVKKGENWC